MTFQMVTGINQGEWAGKQREVSKSALVALPKLTYHDVVKLGVAKFSRLHLICPLSCLLRMLARLIGQFYDTHTPATQQGSMLTRDMRRTLPIEMLLALVRKPERTPTVHQIFFTELQMHSTVVEAASEC